ncbi:hypothetical protein EON80_06720, partial [bacterium]
EALRAVCRSLDGRGPQTRLVSPVMDALEVRSADELVVFVHSEACTRTRIAALSRIVFDLAEEGSSEAADIRARAAALLSLGVRSVAQSMLQKRQERSLNPSGVAPVEMMIALRGGLFEDEYMKASLGFAVSESMARLKRDFMPISSWKIIKPRYDAAVGAAILAQMVA